MEKYNDEQIQIRNATKEDMNAVAGMIQAIRLLNYLVNIAKWDTNPAITVSLFAVKSAFWTCLFWMYLHFGHAYYFWDVPIFGSFVFILMHLVELADFEKMPEGPRLTVNELQYDGFERETPAFYCKVAELRIQSMEPIVGYALYFPTYSTWQGRSMMLEDLYVRPSQRRRGVGERLFQAVAKEASSSDCCRLDFHVLEWNDARSFYESRGAVNLTAAEQWCYYRLAGDALDNVANKK